MKVNVYSVYDKIAQQYNSPFCAPNDTHAVRSFRMEVNRPNDNNVIYHNAKDFALYKVGIFDHDTGTLDHLTGMSNTQTPQLVIEAANLMNTTEDLKQLARTNQEAMLNG